MYIHRMSSPKVDSEIRRLAKLLESVLRFRGGSADTGLRVGARAIERKLGWSAGTLSRVLSGRIELKFRHLFDVLEALEFPAADFFALAYQKRSRSPASQDLLRFLEAQGFRGGLDLDGLAQGEDAISDAELDRRILEALRRISLKAGSPPES